ncbi:hypothetical protein [Paenibacillus thiaminolyticus]|nr:hypothetical protein [Paenibacillus thiaminolyticus]
MKKYIAIALVLVVVLAVLTVPKQDDYASWIKIESSRKPTMC